MLDVLCDEAGLGVAPSRITISTAGHVAGLERLAASRHRPELAVSVNGATDAGRSMPCASPHAATHPFSWVIDSTLASVWLPTASTAPAHRILPSARAGPDSSSRGTIVVAPSMCR